MQLFSVFLLILLHYLLDSYVHAKKKKKTRLPNSRLSNYENETA